MDLSLVVSFFVFKQKTAYEMRISDWSSDVCSSDLLVCVRAETVGRWLGVVDHPDARRKLHAGPTPLVGGIATMAPMLAVAALEGWRQPEHAPLFATLAFATAAFLVLGLADDRNHVSVTARLLISTDRKSTRL